MKTRRWSNFCPLGELCPRLKMAKPLTKHLLVSFAGKHYVLGTLSFNLGKGELVYRFSYPDGLRQHLNLETGKMTPPTDHITWHQNVVNLKRGDEIVDQCVSQCGPLIDGTDYITPLMIETVKFSDAPCVASEANFEFWKGADREHVFDVDDRGFLGSILLLVPTSMPIDQVLQAYWRNEKYSNGQLLVRTYISGLCDGSHCISRFNVWPTYDVLFICSPYCQRPSHIPEEIGTSYRIPNYAHPEEGLQELLFHRQSKKIWDLNCAGIADWLKISEDRTDPELPFALIRPSHMLSTEALKSLLWATPDTIFLS
jgi:hypothetical protein